MIARTLTLAVITACLCLTSMGCRNAPGKVSAEVEALRPEQVHDFATLYGQNCAACHGENGKNGAAISLANPAYIATAGVDNIQRVTMDGVRGTLMPPFGKRSGGFLTDQQIAVLAQGIVANWGRPADFAAPIPLPYASASKGNPAEGQTAFGTFCARCHGNDASGQAGGAGRSGSLLDPSYLALVSDQDLRSMVIAGHSDAGIDWRSYLTGPANQPMTDQEVTDIVAWLTSHRVESPGQPYPQHP